MVDGAATYVCFTIGGDSNTIRGVQAVNCLAGIAVVGTNATIGGTGAGEFNVVSGNYYGIALTGGPSVTGNAIIGNRVGTDNTGTATYANTYGVAFDTGTGANYVGGVSVDEGNLISGNSYGIYFYGGGSGSSVEGNYIGTDITGTSALANITGITFDNTSGVSIGGSRSAGVCNLGCNVISGNDTGVWIEGSAASPTLWLEITLARTPPGIRRSGTVGVGVRLADGANSNTIGGSATSTGNLISGNGTGIQIGYNAASDSNTVQGNLIGAAANGGALPNALNGVAVVNGSSNNIIGGTAPGEANAVNNTIGVDVYSGTGNAIRGNSIHHNGLLGIDLGSNGVTANDAGDGDSGANNLMNFPVITSTVYNGVTTTITGTLDTASPDTATVDVYSNQAGDPEGRVWLGSTTPSGGAWTLVYSGAVPYRNPDRHCDGHQRKHVRVHRPRLCAAGW